MPPTKARRRPGRVYCAIYHHRRSSASSSFHVAQPWHKTTKSQAPTDRPGYVLHLGGGASTTGQSFCSCDLALTLVSSTRTTVHFHRPTKFQTLNRSAENPPHRRLRSIMVHGTKLACDLARHLPIHCSGDSAAPRGGTSGVVLFGSAGRLRSFAVSSLGTRHSEPLRTLRMSNPFDVSVGACLSMESQAQLDFEPEEPRGRCASNTGHGPGRCRRTRRQCRCPSIAPAR